MVFFCFFCHGDIFSGFPSFFLCHRPMGSPLSGRCTVDTLETPQGGCPESPDLHLRRIPPLPSSDSRRFSGRLIFSPLFSSGDYAPRWTSPPVKVVNASSGPGSLATPQPSPVSLGRAFDPFGVDISGFTERVALPPPLLLFREHHERLRDDLNETGPVLCPRTAGCLPFLPSPREVCVDAFTFRS